MGALSSSKTASLFGNNVWIMGYELGSRGMALSLWNWQFQKNGKKGVRL
jgi:hypothetical protein